MQMKQLGKLLFLVGLVPAAVGCYTHVPLDTSVSALPVGERLSFAISDRGRSEIASRMGSGVLRIEGTLVQSDAQAYLLRVWAVSQIEGGTSRWAGEEVRLNRDHVAAVSLRRLERGRTWLTAGVTAAAFGYWVTSQDLFGGFAGGSEENPPPPPVSSRVWW